MSEHKFTVGDGVRIGAGIFIVLPFLLIGFSIIITIALVLYGFVAG